jgi:Stage II sporulation protein E (SpoIIE)
MSADTSELLEELLRRTHLSAPSDVGAVVTSQIEVSLGAREAAVYLVDYEQELLVALRGHDGSEPEPLSLAGTVAGRAFTSTSIIGTPEQDNGWRRVWFPLLDGTERLGVLGATFAEEMLSERLVEACERYAHAVAMLIIAKSQYGDVFEIVRRRRPMTIAAELVWSLAPPLAFATDDLSLAALLEPCYDNGGDALDYVVNNRVLHVGIFDAMGHGLAAAGAAAFALSAYRHSRRAGTDLVSTHAAMHEAVGRQFDGDRFVTALIGELDLDTGALTWIGAGHPPPLLVRGGRRSRALELSSVPPLGVETSATAVVARESLEPRDFILFYTDGLIEARAPDGEPFTLDAVSRFIEREASAGQTAPETLRRIRRAILRREQAELRDDATVLLAEWRAGDERRLMPQTVL